MKKLTQITLLFVLLFTIVFSPAAIAQGAEPAQADGEYLKAVMAFFKDNYYKEIDSAAIYEGAITGMLAAKTGIPLEDALKGIFGVADPYTFYMTNTEYKKFAQFMQGNASMIGARFQKESNWLRIEEVYQASPAQKAGLKSGDRIQAIDGRKVDKMSEDDLLSFFGDRGKDRVILDVIPDGEKSIRRIEVIKSGVEVSPLSYEIIGEVGYIKYRLFSGNSSEYITKALEEFDKNNIQKVIVDIRDNPGGFVNNAIDLTGRFVQKGLVAKEVYRSDAFKDKEHYSRLESSRYKLAVLVNGMSASASETFAGAVQDRKAGVLIGTKTYGKAKIQIDFRLLKPDAYKKYQDKLGGAMVTSYELLTKYYIMPKEEELLGSAHFTTGLNTTPEGRMIDESGIMPDIQVEDPKPLNGVDLKSIGKITGTSGASLHNMENAVFLAESILKAGGYNIEAPDTISDAKTAAALQKLQKDSGLPETGKLDPETIKALNTLLDKIRLENDKQLVKALEYLEAS